MPNPKRQPSAASEARANAAVAQIDCRQRLLSIAGKFSDDEYGNAIATICLFSDVAGKKKLYELSQKFYNLDSVEVSRDDLSLIRYAVEQTRQYDSALVPGQLLVFIDAMREVLGWN